MKIGFISLGNPHSSRTWSGTTSHIFDMLRTKHEVDWLCPRGVRISTMQVTQQAYKKITGKYTDIYRTGRYAMLLGRSLIKEELRKYDLLFSIGSTEISFLETDTPIVHLTDATYQQLVGYYDYPAFAAPLREEADSIQRQAYEHAGQVIFASKWAADSGTHYYGIPPERANVIHFGPNVAVPSDAHVGDDRPGIRMLFIGRDWKRKGGEIALGALDAMNKKGVDASLTIVGCDPGINLTKRKDVTVVPNAPDLAAYYGSSNVFLLPTRAECAGIVFCEASAFGLPSFTTDTGGVGDYVENGVNGFRLSVDATGEDYADQILSLFNDRDRFKALARSTRRRYEEDLNWNTWLGKFEKVAEKALSGN
jgi:glycosyltransferase involved in cell wall biosynthesis